MYSPHFLPSLAAVGALAQHGEGLLHVPLLQVAAGERHHHHGADLLRAPGQGDQGPPVHPLRQLAIHVS